VRLPAHAVTGTAPTMPEMCPARVGVVCFETQALLACDEVLPAANADVPAAVRVAVAAATRTKIERRRRRLNALATRVLHDLADTTGLQAAPLRRRPGQSTNHRSASPASDSAELKAVSKPLNRVMWSWQAAVAEQVSKLRGVRFDSGTSEATR
jgi:hypothetical protein